MRQSSTSVHCSALKTFFPPRVSRIVALSAGFPRRKRRNFSFDGSRIMFLVIFTNVSSVRNERSGVFRSTTCAIASLIEDCFSSLITMNSISASSAGGSICTSVSSTPALFPVTTLFTLASFTWTGKSIFASSNCSLGDLAILFIFTSSSFMITRSSSLIFLFLIASISFCARISAARPASSTALAPVDIRSPPNVYSPPFGTSALLES
mmetsp:Transcript_8155/g.13156  ORF Transcript_8155/g.13156 Transcript_8155/m.13156 type:complete len:209 (-) Transcript_8155:308-934(-)